MLIFVVSIFPSQIYYIWKSTRKESLYLCNLKKKTFGVLNFDRGRIKEFKPRCLTAKTGSNWALSQISKHWIQFQVDTTMYEPRL